MKLPATFFSLMICTSCVYCDAVEVELAQLEQESLRSAIEQVEPCVVQIRTVGGLDRIGRTSIAQGPTTGLIVSEDGYIVSSAFNFVRRPTSVMARLPSGNQVAAELVARDRNRMLVLLKVEAEEPLPVPTAVPRDELQVGQWAVALGRTFRADRVGVSVGILSGKNRMYGRVVQTDAKISAANYGGPLVDVQGRVIGVLTPMSPQASGDNAEMAGAEYYDSGIGFAVPLADVLEILPRLKLGEDLLPGKLGVGLKQGSVHVAPAEITTVWRGSPAASAGWKPQDMIVQIDGKPVKTQAQLRFALKPRYAGDELSVTVKRGEGDAAEEITRTVILSGELQSYEHSFLGILPERTEPGDEKGGLVVRDTWPDSPAAGAGLMSGDRILKLDEQEIAKSSDALQALSGIAPGDETEVTFLRDGREQTLRVELEQLPSEILSWNELPLETEENGKEQPVELKSLKIAEFVQIANYYAPETAGERPGLLIWLADGEQDDDLDLAKRWRKAGCKDAVLVIAHSREETGWSGDDGEFLSILARTATTRFSADPQRTAVAGSGKAGQLAFTLAFTPRSSFSGVVSLDAPLPRTLRLPANLPGRRLAVLAIETPESSFVPLIRKNVEELQDAGYATSWWKRPPVDPTSSEPDDATLDTIARWLAGLDRF